MTPFAFAAFFNDMSGTQENCSPLKDFNSSLSVQFLPLTFMYVDLATTTTAYEPDPLVVPVAALVLQFPAADLEEAAAVATLALVP